MDRAAAVTDVLVALVGFASALACASRRTLASTVAAVALLAPAIAAVLGALRFTGVESVTPQHLVAVHVAATVGMPLIGLSFVLSVARPTHARIIAGVVFASLGALSFAVSAPGYRTIAGAAGMIASAIAGTLLARRDRLAGAVGASAAMLVVVDGLVIGGPGDLAGMSRTAWFHVVFAVAIGTLAFALLRASSAARSRGRCRAQRTAWCALRAAVARQRSTLCCATPCARFFSSLLCSPSVAATAP